MSSTAIEELEPQRVFHHFAQLLAIPRPSGHEEGVASWLKQFAAANGFDYKKDTSGNVIITAPASKGCEKAPSLILQGHMDMVPVAADGVRHDFLKDPIEAFAEDGFLKAKGTTLGADDGLGVCTALAILEDKDLPHGPLKAVFTVEEETTMKGALGLSADDLKADCLINLDSEDDGQLFIGCAGSADVNITLDTENVSVPGTKAYTLALSHFAGGHSGSDINAGTANTVSLLAGLLLTLSDDFEIFLKSLEGGSVRNAIPSSAKAVVLVPEAQAQDFEKAVKEAFDKAYSVYERTDPEGSCDLAQCPNDGQAMSLECTLELLSLIRALPNRVMRMSDSAPEIVETSSNLGMVRTFGDHVLICEMPRSLKERGLDEAIAVIAAAASLAGADVAVEHRHPCWLCPDHGTLVEVMQESYHKVTGREFKITAIHAGLECAQFAKLNPGLAMISVGSTILNPHSPKERAGIKGCAELYETVRLAVKALSEK